jgi:3-methyladenine DNA glycosylase AlkC
VFSANDVYILLCHSKLLKNIYNDTYINLLSNNLYNSINNYDKKHKFNILNFKKSIFNDTWENKELKQRMHHISNMMAIFLPYNYTLCISILKDVFDKMHKMGDYIYGLENMIFADYVEIYGLDKNNYTISINALSHFTINCSSEFAIRAFIIKYPKQTMKHMRIWALDKNEHIRRLSSEGCRPKLPWSIALEAFNKEPKEVLKILEILKNDTSKYVAKSVANNLNDISKNHPSIVINVVSRWLKEHKEYIKNLCENSENTTIKEQKNKEVLNKNFINHIKWLTKHGCRTLLKQGNKQTLELFGFVANNDIEIVNFNVDKAVAMGEFLNFSFSIVNKKTNNIKINKALGKLRIEYFIYFKRLNNKISKKIFHISQNEIKQNTKQINKKHSFKPISTRAYYKGKHKISIVVNGIELKEKEFLLN